MAVSPGPRRRFARLARYAPLPFVAVTVLLIVLILITPVLVSSGQPAPGILTQAELVVDRLPGNATMHFYVHGLGTTVRYAEIWIGVALGFNWSVVGRTPWTSLRWNIWQNDTFVLTSSYASVDNPIALNVTAYYSSSGGSAWYGGVLAFEVTSGASGQVLNAVSETASVAVPSSVPVDNSSLPFPITLATVSAGGFT